ncbi:5-oxoprolinase subunit PxpA [Aestuariibacter salexigens]|uniref:5-oxoprolinase subunit PxpA n=1 Tax=Aestuariibacter salexigens TaxID=226010 RepID=UPI0003FE7FEF|nr:5-oxoprolinase subunit PxpA [Aestuariibacter salexigens]
MLINCDLGEGFGAWKMGQDEQLMPYVDQANIACGFHAGDPVVMQRAVHHAKLNHVSIGAHPAYPDLQGFGRRSMRLSHSELIALLHYQIGALEGVAQSLGASVDYVKPHGALYNDMMADTDLLDIVMQGVADYHRPLSLMIQATPNWQTHQHMADKHRLTLLFEAFADRRYLDNGQLQPRAQPGAVLDAKQCIQQARQLIKEGKVTTVSGHNLSVKADTLCVHGDGEEALSIAAQLRSLIDELAS